MRNQATNEAGCPVAPILQQTVYTKTLHRACQVLGGIPQLATHLRVSMRELDLWLKGREVPPQGVFLAAVDIALRAERN